MLMNCVACLAAVAIGLGFPAPAGAAIGETEVIVVYNSLAPEAVALKDAYLAAHPGIPTDQVLDLASAVLVANPADLTYAQFKSEIRDPIRSFLAGGRDFSPESIIAIVLIRPMPHRIRDGDVFNAGDNVNQAVNELNAGDATYSSVDAELVLLWQDLDAGEAGGTMDSFADNMIDNPYHQRTHPIDQCADCSRANITLPKGFNPRQNVVWELNCTGGCQPLTPGDLYLVARIDGTTLADATASIERAMNLRINRATSICLLDEYDVLGGADDLDDDRLFLVNDPFLAGNDYEEATALLSADGWTVRYDGTFDFVSCTEETRPIVGYSSYGENHDVGGNGENPPGAATYIDCFRFPPGAMFNTAESDNGRALNGLGSQFGLEQLADFLAAGGSFAVGNVFEPFTFSLPDNEFLFVNFLSGGLSWGEAAYSSLPALSWQQIVVGDPLAMPVILDDPGLPKGDLNGDGSVNGPDIQWMIELILEGPADYYAAFPTLDPVARGDFTDDLQVGIDDAPEFVTTLLGP